MNMLQLLYQDWLNITEMFRIVYNDYPVLVFMAFLILSGVIQLHYRFAGNHQRAGRRHTRTR